MKINVFNYQIIKHHLDKKKYQLMLLKMMRLNFLFWKKKLFKLSIHSKIIIYS